MRVTAPEQYYIFDVIFIKFRHPDQCFVRFQVAEMQKELEALQPELVISTAENEELMIVGFCCYFKSFFLILFYFLIHFRE